MTSQPPQSFSRGTALVLRSVQVTFICIIQLRRGGGSGDGNLFFVAQTAVHKPTKLVLLLG